MKALVFAAGLGTRLRPVTDRMPKALVPVGGVPMLERVIRKLADAGAESVVVNACYLSDMIADFIAGKDLGVGVSLSVEPGDVPLETGGGIKRAAGMLRGGRFIVHNVDILSSADLRGFIAEDRPDSLASLLVTPDPEGRCLLFDEEMRLVGWTDLRTGEVRSPYRDLDVSSCRKYSFCGIHVISDEVFPLMESWGDRFGIIDFYLSVCDRYPIRGIVAENLTLVDIGTPESLALAERIYSSMM